MLIQTSHSNKIIIMTPLPVYFTAAVADLEIIIVHCCFRSQSVQNIFLIHLPEISITLGTAGIEGYRAGKVKPFHYGLVLKESILRPYPVPSLNYRAF